MNENAYKGYSPETVSSADDYALFDDLERNEPEAKEESDASLLRDETPRLSLVRPDDDDDAADDAVDCSVPAELCEQLSHHDESILDDDYGELWLAEAAGDHAESVPVAEHQVNSRQESDASGYGLTESFDLDNELPIGLDHSAVEDVVITNPLAERREQGGEEAAIDSSQAAFRFPTPEASRGFGATLATGRFRVGTPNGAKLNWKPGDPFGSSEGVSDRFRWELMLTTACITAVCGMGGIWLLRTILA